MLACEKTSFPSITDIEQIHILNFINQAKSISKWGGRRDQSGKFQQSLEIFSDIIYFSCNVLSHWSWLFLYYSKPFE